MKLNGDIRSDDLPELVTGHRFERLIIFYADADGLRQGFQFWMRYLGACELGCDCVPVFLGDGIPHARVGKTLKTPCRKALVLICPSSDGRESKDLGARVLEILARDKSTQRGLVVLLPDEAASGSWPWIGALSESPLFTLGRFAASPCGPNHEKSPGGAYNLRSLLSGADHRKVNGRRSTP